jgi:hypothetical protein
MDDLADGMMVIMGRPFQQFQESRRQERVLVQDLQHFFEAPGSQSGSMGLGEHDTDAGSVPERYPHPHSRHHVAGRKLL